LLRKRGRAMIGKPKSHHALILAVLHCAHPALDGADKSILACLVENGDHGKGENCRPGNRNLEDAVRLKPSAASVRIKRLIEYGLIERTEVGDGQRNASVYRILWRSSHYPDRTPNVEWLIDKPGCVVSPDNEPSGPDRMDAKNEPSGPDRMDAPGTIRSEGGNHPVTRPEPSGTEPGTIRSGPEHTCITHPPSHLPTHLPANGGGLEGWIQKNIDQMGVPNKGVKEILDGKVRAKGEENVVRALDKFLTRPNGLEGLRTPWSKCLTEIDAYLSSVDTKNLLAVREAKEEEFQQASIERQTQEIVRRRDARAATNEETVDDFLNALNS
jgi:predicted transcriptional regulator